MNKNLELNIGKLERLSEKIGLDYYPINYEIVPQEVMLEVISYGLPTRARHWSYGQFYDYQKMQGEMGFSKIYEVVLNNNPSYAFLLDTNTDIANTMIAAHVMGHVHFFKHNHLFMETDRKMVYHAAERAQRIENYIEKYGIGRVEKWMDVGFALDKHIDWHKGVNRDRYSPPEKIIRKKKKDGFEDLSSNSSLSCEEVMINESFPPYDEYDILWFLTNYADLEVWQKDILEIIRHESYYFYPQYMTKIMNEGFASFIHAELMYLFDDISPADYIEFCKIHEKVIQPGPNKLSINPYFLGFSILKNIREKWDEAFKAGDSEIGGLEKIYQVIKEEEDISFIRNYLNEELVEELELFTYVIKVDKNNGKIIEIVSKDLEDVTESIVKDLYHYRSPLICIKKAAHDIMELEHVSSNVGTLDSKHLERVMEYLFVAWGAVVNVESADDSGETVHYTYDELGFSG